MQKFLDLGMVKNYIQLVETFSQLQQQAQQVDTTPEQKQELADKIGVITFRIQAAGSALTNMPEEISHVSGVPFTSWDIGYPVPIPGSLMMQDLYTWFQKHYPVAFMQEPKTGKPSVFLLICHK